MNYHLTRQVFTSTRPLSAGDRLDIWKAKLRARTENNHEVSPERTHNNPGSPLSVLAWVRSFFAGVKNS